MITGRVAVTVSIELAKWVRRNVRNSIAHRPLGDGVTMFGVVQDEGVGGIIERQQKSRCGCFACLHIVSFVFDVATSRGKGQFNVVGLMGGAARCFGLGFLFSIHTKPT